METAFWIALVALPFVGGLHSFSVNYGYRGVSKPGAQEDAWFAFKALTVACCLCGAAKMIL